MAQRFNFMKRVNGSIETFYPKTATDNVVKETPNGEKKLDTILDEKGAFMEYNEENANESTGTDLMFDVLGDVIDSEKIEHIKGTIVGDTEPEDTRYLWIDKSGETAAMKFYNTDTEAWEQVTIAENSDVELSVDDEGVLNVVYDDGLPEENQTDPSGDESNVDNHETTE